MKILDSTIIIAIIAEIKCVQLIDKILKLEHDLVITHSVYQEILAGTSGKICTQLIRQKKINLIQLNTKEQIGEYKKTYPQLGNGEIDSILSFDQLSKNNDSTYCIFDDGVARKKAQELGIKFTGFLGLLKIMKQRQILTDGEYGKIMTELKGSKFRLPNEIC